MNPAHHQPSSPTPPSSGNGSHIPSFSSEQKGQTVAKRSPFDLRDFSLAIALAVLMTFFAIQTPYFFSARNLSMLSIELSITAVLALGMLLVILPGNIDLSVGSGVGLIGGIAAVLIFNHNFPAPVALGLATVVAIILWSAMGALIVFQRIPAFIITLGGLLIFKGLFWLVIASQTIPIVSGGGSNLYSALTTYYLTPKLGAGVGALLIFGAFFERVLTVRNRRKYQLPIDDSWRAALRLVLITLLVAGAVFVSDRFRGVPLPVLILIVVAISIHILTTKTPFGRYLYAIGGNEDAARLSGVPVQRVVVGTFGIMGVLVAITGFMQTAYGGASTTTVGDLMELDAIAACVIGGTSLRGGRGSVIGVILGALIMATLNNGMTLMAVSPEFKFIVRGAVLTAAVWMDVVLTRRSNR